MENETNDESSIDYDKDPAVLKVATKTEKDDLVIAIVKCIKKHGYAKVKAIGGGAIQKAYEAILEARVELIKFDTDLIIIPNGFLATMPDGKMRHGALMVVERR